MYLTRYNPFNEFRGLANLAELKKEKENLFIPQVNAREDETAFYVDVDLPGIPKDAIKVDIKDNKLIISGERNFKAEVKEEDYYRVETRFGAFKRLFSLPEHIDSNKISASHENGVLEIMLPKKAELETVKSIKIK